MGEFAHYTARRRAPPGNAELRKRTLLLGGLTWKHDRMLQAALTNLGYRVEVLPTLSRGDLDAGKELIDFGACCPVIFLSGNLANFLKARVAAEGEEAVAQRYVFLTAGSCGPCRFGQYHESYRLALEGIGLPDLPVLVVSTAQAPASSGQGTGFQVTLDFILGVTWALACADLLTELEYMTRPYEVIPGETDRVLSECVEQLCTALRERPATGGGSRTLAWYVLSGYFERHMRAIRRRWEAIEIDRLRVKPKVKVTGEFWLQAHEGEGNYDIKRWLEREGAEVVSTPVTVFLDYLVWLHGQKLRDSGPWHQGLYLRQLLPRVVRGLFHRAYDRLRHALGGLPQALPDQNALARLAAPYYHRRLDGGEGHMLIGKALHAHRHNTAHMICELTPYSCMPNTMSVGAMASVQGRFPDLLYAPIEVKGDAEVHALSRCQMILTEAKKRAQREFELTLERSNMTPENIRRYEAAHPCPPSTKRLARRGYAGTAASYVAHVGAALGRATEHPLVGTGVDGGIRAGPGGGSGPHRAGASQLVRFGTDDGNTADVLRD